MFIIFRVPQLAIQGNYKNAKLAKNGFVQSQVFKRTFIFRIILSIRGSGWGKGGSAIVVLIVRILLRLGFIIIVSAHIALIIRVVAHISVETAISTSPASAEAPSTARVATTP